MRNLLRPLLVASIAISSVFAQATDLFFSEYIEGSSNNKALEIFNPTTEAVNLSQYAIQTSSNGGGWYDPDTLSGTLEAGGTYVIINPDWALFPTDSSIVDTIWGAYETYFNGDDARALAKLVSGNWEIIDIIGDPDNDPGTGWDVAGVAAGTANHTLVRKSTITAGDTSWAASAGTDSASSQWLVYDQDVHFLGEHNPISVGTIVSIHDIQYVTDPATNDTSAYLDSSVTISGIVTSEFWGSYKNRYMFVQDANTAWSGIMLFEYSGWDTYDFTVEVNGMAIGTTNSVAQGDSVTITGTIDEYYGMTELVDVTSVIIHGQAVNPPAPIAVTTLDIATGNAAAEMYEGVLVEVMDADATFDDAYWWSTWSADDGSGACRVGNIWGYYYFPTTGDSLASIVGTVDYAYDNFRLQPRLAMDVDEAGPYTRLQAIQQVRGSDLLKTPVDAISDTSYFRGDTVSIKGIVTMPTGLSYAGDGIKYIFQDPNGGPWSGILSYDEDSTAFPVLFEGDEVEAIGYIDEYITSPSNMTELWITQPISVISIGNP
ncbi:MAG: lamin tail domain-containing protein, partial [Candidatus Marinimicrobia bacterium]|nr:lamin tail domain-containing protein [Candidatus Neomarinimicrobiota bacterium]